MRRLCFRGGSRAGCLLLAPARPDNATGTDGDDERDAAGATPAPATQQSLTMSSARRNQRPDDPARRADQQAPACASSSRARGRPSTLDRQRQARARWRPEGYKPQGPSHGLGNHIHSSWITSLTRLLQHGPALRARTSRVQAHPARLPSRPGTKLQDRGRVQMVTFTVKGGATRRSRRRPATSGDSDNNQMPTRRC